MARAQNPNQHFPGAWGGGDSRWSLLNPLDPVVLIQILSVTDRDVSTLHPTWHTSKKPVFPQKQKAPQPLNAFGCFLPAADILNQETMCMFTCVNIHSEDFSFHIEQGPHSRVRTAPLLSPVPCGVCVLSTRSSQLTFPSALYTTQQIPRVGDFSPSKLRTPVTQSALKCHSEKAKTQDPCFASSFMTSPRQPLGQSV